MKDTDKSPLVAVIRKYEAEILAEWITAQAAGGSRRDATLDSEQRNVSRDFLAAIVQAMREGSVGVTASGNWTPVRELLGEFSARRANQGHSPAETATFVFSLKKPLFSRLQKEITDPQAMADAFWDATLLNRQLGLYTTEAYQKTREKRDRAPAARAARAVDAGGGDVGEHPGIPSSARWIAAAPRW